MVDEKVSIRVNTAQKNQLKRLAGLASKSLSSYIRDTVLAATSLDNAKMDFYLSINNNLTHLMKSQLVMTQLMLLIGAEQLHDQDQIMTFYRERVADAEKRLGGE